MFSVMRLDDGPMPDVVKVNPPGGAPWICALVTGFDLERALSPIGDLFTESGHAKSSMSNDCS
jgi:hypothetical protein